MGQLFGAIGQGLGAVGNSVGNFMHGGGLLGHLFGMQPNQNQSFVPSASLNPQGGQTWAPAQSPYAAANGVNQLGIGGFLSHLFGGH